MQRYSTPVHVVPGTGTLTIVIGGTLDKIEGRFGVEARIESPEGNVFDTTQSSGNLHVHRDPYFMNIHLEEPASGEWNVELRRAEGSAEVQSGTLTIYGDSTRLDSAAFVNPSILPSASDSADVRGFSSYVSRLSEYEGFGVSLTGPTGQDIGFSSSENQYGAIESVISSLPYRGGYQVEVIYDTGATTYNKPGEQPTQQPLSTSIPSTVYGQIGSLFVESGPDPGSSYRTEAESQ